MPVQAPPPLETMARAREAGYDVRLYVSGLPATWTLGVFRHGVLVRGPLPDDRRAAWHLAIVLARGGEGAQRASER